MTRGGELAGLRRYDEAVEEFRAAIRVAGRPIFTAYLNMGSVFFSKRDYSQAVEAFRQALAVRPNSFQGHYNLGIALLERNQPEAAQQEFKVAIEQEKTAWPEAQYNFAKALERQNRFREAADAYEVYLKLAPDAADAKTTREYIDYLRRKNEGSNASWHESSASEGIAQSVGIILAV